MYCYLLVFLLWVKIDVKCQTSRLPPVWEIAVHLAIASDVFDGVFLLSLFPQDVLDEILGLIESVSDDFPTYFYGSSD